MALARTLIEFNKPILWIFASSRILSVTAFLISAIVWTEFKRLLVNTSTQHKATFERAAIDLHLKAMLSFDC